MVSTDTDALPTAKAVAEFILDRYSQQLASMCAGGSSSKPIGLPISVLDILDFDPRFGALLISAGESEAILSAGLAEAMKMLTLSAPKGCPSVQVRLHSLPLSLHACSLARIDGSPGRLVQFEGIVIRTGAVRMRERCKLFECVSCSFRMHMECDEQQFGAIVKPASCPNAREDGTRCRSSKFAAIHTDGTMETCEDYQEIRVQETARTSSIPRTASVLLRADLVDTGQVGDQVVVVGRVCIRWKPAKAGQRVSTETIIVASSVQSAALRAAVKAPKAVPAGQSVLSMTARDELVGMLCPEVLGMFPVKLAVVLTLIGGSAEAGLAGRRHGHLLLVGDPGTAKSHFLRAAVKLCRRSVFVSGAATTSAGLTVAAVKESGGGWGLEAGALVLADGGLVCIDEFAAVRPADRTALHEALEQQQVSVAKAGIVCRLPTRCSVLAACNTRDKYDGDLPITANIAIASPLLSRFDLIFVLLDRRNEEYDRRLCRHVLQEDKPVKGGDDPSSALLFDYIASVREHRVEMTLEAQGLLSSYYQRQRQQDLRDAARTTIRLLESMVRLAEAHAKLVQSATVRDVDAAVAIRLVDLSLTRRSGEVVQDALYSDSLLPGHCPDTAAVAYLGELGEMLDGGVPNALSRNGGLIS